MYEVVWESSVEENLRKIDRTIVRKIKDKVENYLVKNPQRLGEPLTGQYKGFYRCKFSDYRVIYEIKQSELLIIVIKVGHRREVY